MEYITVNIMSNAEFLKINLNLAHKTVKYNLHWLCKCSRNTGCHLYEKLAFNGFNLPEPVLSVPGRLSIKLEIIFTLHCPIFSGELELVWIRFTLWSICHAP